MKEFICSNAVWEKWVRWSLLMPPELLLGETLLLSTDTLTSFKLGCGDKGSSFLTVVVVEMEMLVEGFILLLLGCLFLLIKQWKNAFILQHICTFLTLVLGPSLPMSSSGLVCSSRCIPPNVAAVPQLLLCTCRRCPGLGWCEHLQASLQRQRGRTSPGSRSFVAQRFCVNKLDVNRSLVLAFLCVPTLTRFRLRCLTSTSEAASVVRVLLRLTSTCSVPRWRSLRIRAGCTPRVPGTIRAWNRGRPRSTAAVGSNPVRKRRKSLAVRRNE